MEEARAHNERNKQIMLERERQRIQVEASLKRNFYYSNE